MKRLLVRILGTALSFYAVSALVAGFHITPSWTAYLIASFVFVVLNWIVSPIVKLLLLPINLLTLGLFRWVASVIVLYVFDLVYSGITISAYNFTGYNSGLISLPPLHLSLFWTLVASSFVMSVTYSIFSTLLNTES